MKKFYTTLAGFFLVAMTAAGQAHLTPAEGYKVAYWFPDLTEVQRFDLTDTMFYYCDLDSVYQMDLSNGQILKSYGKPADYTVISYPSFLAVSPGGGSLWAGYTDFNNEDPRIYAIDVVSGEWKLMARMAGNYDLVFWNDSILVSGQNSTDWSSPNAIFVLDTTGADQHRKIVETGGYSSGMAVDSAGNLYYGTSTMAGPHALYSWDSADLAAVIKTPAAPFLTTADAVKLSDLPLGASGCEVDESGNVVFAMNQFLGTNVLGLWNGTEGDGHNYDTLALSEIYMGSIGSTGNFTIPERGNSLIVAGYDTLLADLHTADYSPVLTRQPLPITGHEGELLDPIDLSEFVTDPDDPDQFTFSISVMSETGVADLSIEGNLLTGSFTTSGQSNLVIDATNAGTTISGKTVVGTWPVLEGDFLVADFEDLTLGPESYWNGMDGSGSFVSGPATFRNDYNPEYYSWSGWSYSNTSDVTTAGWMNQYSAVAGEGFSENGAEGGNYGLTSLYGPSIIRCNGGKAHHPEGFFVTNSTYAALSMEQGDFFAKRFGGADGSDPDFFLLSVWGMVHGLSTDTIDYHLADYRPADQANDYIIKTWQWVDLSPLGKVDSLIFSLTSSDMGDWGMNTPAYFCMDNLHINPDKAPVVVGPIGDMALTHENMDTVVNLSHLFMDPDDPDSTIVIEVVSNSNGIPGISMNGDQIFFNWPLSAPAGETEIVLAGTVGGLSVTDTFRIAYQGTSEVKELDTNSMKLYPNPSTGLFYLTAEGMEMADVRIYSLTGSLVYEAPGHFSGTGIDLTAQPPGTYIVRVTMKNRVISRKIDIQ